MPKNSSPTIANRKWKERHKFFLNTYSDCAFTKCPKCDTKTKVRKFPLVIHIQPQQLFILNKQCKYCERCDLIIAKKQELESLMTAGFIQSNPKIIGNDYMVMGTVDRKDWKEGNQNAIAPSEMLDRVYVFQDIWDFEVIPAGWYRSAEE